MSGDIATQSSNLEICF